MLRVHILMSKMNLILVYYVYIVQYLYIREISTFFQESFSALAVSLGHKQND